MRRDRMTVVAAIKKAAAGMPAAVFLLCMLLAFYPAPVMAQETERAEAGENKLPVRVIMYENGNISEGSVLDTELPYDKAGEASGRSILLKDASDRIDLKKYVDKLGYFKPKNPDGEDGGRESAEGSNVTFHYVTAAIMDSDGTVVHYQVTSIDPAQGMYTLQDGTKARMSDGQRLVMYYYPENIEVAVSLSLDGKNEDPENRKNVIIGQDAVKISFPEGKIAYIAAGSSMRKVDREVIYLKNTPYGLILADNEKMEGGEYLTDDPVMEEMIQTQMLSPADGTSSEEEAQETISEPETVTHSAAKSKRRVDFLTPLVIAAMLILVILIFFRRKDADSGDDGTDGDAGDDWEEPIS